MTEKREIDPREEIRLIKIGQTLKLHKPLWISPDLRGCGFKNYCIKEYIACIVTITNSIRFNEEC